MPLSVQTMPLFIQTMPLSIELCDLPPAMQEELLDWKFKGTHFSRISVNVALVC
jgi:hypothetical protein